MAFPHLLLKDSFHTDCFCLSFAPQLVEMFEGKLKIELKEETKYIIHVKGGQHCEWLKVIGKPAFEFL